MSVTTDVNIPVKLCTKCKEVKDLSSFTKNSTRPDGFTEWCRPCKSAADKDYRNRNLEKCRKTSRDYYAKNSEVLKEKVKQYAKNNSEIIKHKKAIYFQENKSKWSEYYKNRAIVDPVFKMKMSIRRLIVKVMRGSKTQRCEQILGCSYSDLHKHIESQFEPWMTWENKGKYSGTLNYGWDVDHIIPLCTAKTVEDIIRLNHYTNLRPLCSHVNRNIKRGKYE
jgi:hypothetical protein